MKKLIPLLLVIAPTALMAQDLPKPRYMGDFELPTGVSLHGIEIGGLSDLSYDAKTGSFALISDDRAQHGPVRFYRMKFDLQKGKFAGLDIEAMHELKAPGGKPFAENGADPEGIALDPDHNRVFWSSERDQNNVPALYASAPDGTDTRSIPLPAAFMPKDSGNHGIRPNLGFEGLTLSRDGKTLIAATENPLFQDGQVPDLKTGGPARLITYDVDTLKPGPEYVYNVDPIPAAPARPGDPADNGISAMAALPGGGYVIVERSWAKGTGDNIRFYTISFDGATDVAGQDTLDMSKVTPVKKTLWFQLSDADNPFSVRLDNIEAIDFGPVIDGKQSMFIEADNNFSHGEINQFGWFSVDLPHS